jgi:hypothetical protein
MSTFCGIAVKTDKGYKTIYCHWDGYPGYMYPLLRDWYGTEERALALVSFGNASSIKKRLVPSVDSGHSFDKPEDDVCVFYHRDRGEDWEDVEPVFYSKESLLRDYYYSYVFEDGHWSAYKCEKEIEIS